MSDVGPPLPCRLAAAVLPALLVSGALLTMGCGQGPSPTAPDARPLDVILVTIDTLRADALGAYGQELPSSPNLDVLASGGVLFEHCVASAPSTLPSHASIMTGKQPYSHGARDNEGYVLAAEQVTLAERLKERGYRTHAEIAAPVIGRRTLLNQGFDEYRDLSSFDVARLKVNVEGETKTLVQRGAADITNRGLQFLASSGDAPYFLWLHYFDPHVFYVPPPLFQDLVPESEYHAEVRYVDAQVARVVAWLQAAGRAEHTLVVVTSDHGEGLGEHDELTHSYFVYDTTMRVPLIFWAPGRITEPRRVGSLVRSIDIAPTILDLLDLSPLEGAQGVSLLPLIEGRESTLGLVGYGESLRPLMTFGTSVLRTVREGGWKYIHKVEPELYDVQADPGELNNLASQHPERLEGLRGRLRELVAAAPEAGAEAYGGVDATTQAHLQALGYVATSVRPDTEAVNSLEVTGVDASLLGKDIQQLALAHGYLSGRILDKAEAAFADLMERHPRSIAALSGMIATLNHQGRYDELPDLLRRGVELGTTRADYYTDLAKFVAEDGDSAEAERLIRQALELQPCSTYAWVRLANLLHGQGEYARQIAALEEAVASCPDATDLRNDLAYALATTPADELRDGARALELARVAVAEGAEQPAYLDTLACALAENGNPAEAARVARRAIQLLESREFPDEIVDSFRGNLASFEAGRPVRD